MQPPKIIRIGTRKSPLALAQAQMTQTALIQTFPALAQEGAVKIVPMETSGDRFLAGPLYDAGGKGLFTKEIEDALLASEIDIAVHSLKDVPAFLPDGLILGAYLEREDPRDALICAVASKIANLPQGAVVGTSSVRRSAFLRMQRPDLKLVPLRGNVGTRLAKLERGEAVATLLAMAGLNRLKYQSAQVHPIPIEEMLPSAGQGIIAIECREADEPVRRLLEKITHSATESCAKAERGLLAILDGSCRTPIGGLAEIEGDTLTLRGIIARLDGTKCAQYCMSGPIHNAEYIGREMGEYLRVHGGQECLA